MGSCGRTSVSITGFQANLRWQRPIAKLLFSGHPANKDMGQVRPLAGPSGAAEYGAGRDIWVLVAHLIWGQHSRIQLGQLWLMGEGPRAVGLVSGDSAGELPLWDARQRGICFEQVHSYLPPPSFGPATNHQLPYLLNTRCQVAWGRRHRATGVACRGLRQCLVGSHPAQLL